MSEQRTEIGSLGEFGLIDHLTKNIELKNASSILGVGDDAAVIDHFGKQTVIKQICWWKEFISIFHTRHSNIWAIRPSR